jgi:glycosyltransferase involved in cell wall biosynthesis
MIHGRPSGHPLHKKYGESISAEFIPVDFILRWHDNNSSSIRKYLSWFLCAVFFPNKKKYDVFLCEGPHLMVALMKCLSIIKKHQKVILLLGDETLYFLYTNRYNKITKTALKWFIKKSDGVICPGVLGKKLVNSLNLVSDNKIKLLFNGVEETRLNNLLQISPNLNSFNIVFIGNISGEWRAWYKGFDLLLVTLEKLQCKIPNLTLTVIGDIEPDFYEPYSRKLAPTFFKNYFFGS